MRNVLLLLFIVLTSCSSKLKEIPLEEIPEDLKWVSDQTAKNILEFCDDEVALNEFNQRSAVKSHLQATAGKHFLTCIVYSTEVTEVQLGKLYRVNRLDANVKRFKYKLEIVSEKYDLMELHLDLNSDKFIAKYTIHGKQKDDGKWVSVLDKLELDMRKFMKNLK